MYTLRIIPTVLTAALSLLVVGAGAPTPIFAQAAGTAAPIVWPMTVSSAAGKIVVYEPQVRSWPNFTQMTGVAAIAVTMAGASGPVYGTVSFDSLASADVPSGMVSLVNPKIEATSWPTASQTDATGLDAFLKANLHLEGKPLLPLAMVLGSLPPAARPKTVPLRTNPPVIEVSKVPAVLIVFDGKPAFEPIPGTTLTYAANTNWAIVHDPASGLFYVHAKAGWFSSPGSAGPFTPTVAPASFAAIPTTGKWSHLHTALNAPKPTVAVPKVFVSFVPAALIDIGGEPQYASIAGTQLRYVTNTDSALFFSRETTVWYVLLSGRWFSAANLNGPWTFASAHLPADFKKIPEDSPRGYVLVSVPGTTQAFYAANAAQVPQIKTVDPATVKLTVAYDSGTPNFGPIAGTPLKYALNSATDVIEVDASHYFACDSGVWFTSSSPSGPWTPATYVPAVIYTIPASSPLYHVTFVHVYDNRGVALTAPLPTPAPKPGDTYQTFAAGQASAGTRASFDPNSAYYYASSGGYIGGYAAPWGGYAGGTGYYSPGYIGKGIYLTNPPTYGNYDDTTFAREQRQADAQDPRRAPAILEMPGHGPRTVLPPNANVFAADDGVYRFASNDWEKNTGADNWAAAATGVPPSLNNDRAARLDGYNGRVSSSS
jgi:hypothetical protein